VCASALPRNVTHIQRGRKSYQKLQPLQNPLIIFPKARVLLSGIAIRGPLTTGKITLSRNNKSSKQTSPINLTKALTKHTACYGTTALMSRHASAPVAFEQSSASLVGRRPRGRTPASLEGQIPLEQISASLEDQHPSSRCLPHSRLPPLGLRHLKHTSRPRH
jgi:hypothetical protein